MPRRKTKEAKPQEVTPAEVKQEEKPQEVKPVEAKPQELSPPQPPKPEAARLVINEVKPAPAPKPTAPIIRSITWEEFERFEESSGSGRRSWVKEAIEAAKSGPVMLEGLTRGQVAALINYVDKYNSESRNTPKIAYKYDVKKGVVLLAPVVKK
jgi:hypothetical protein